PYGALEGWNWPPRSSRYQRLLPPTSGRSQQIRAASFTPRPAGRRAFTGLRLLGSPHRFLSLRNCRYSQSLSTKKVCFTQLQILTEKSTVSSAARTLLTSPNLPRSRITPRASSPPPSILIQKQSTSGIGC